MNNKRETVERLRIILEETGLSIRKFAQKIGLQADSGGRILSGKSKLSKSLSYAIELKLGYRAEWLQTGALPMRTETEPPLCLEHSLYLEMNRPDPVESDSDLREALILRQERKVVGKLDEFQGLMNYWGLAGNNEDALYEQFEKEAPQLRALFGEWVLLLEGLKQKPLVNFRRCVLQALWCGSEWKIKKLTSNAYSNLQATFTLKAYKHLEKDFTDVLEAFLTVEKQIKSLLHLSQEQCDFVEASKNLQRHNPELKAQWIPSLLNKTENS